MLGCESLSTTKIIICSVYREATYTQREHDLALTTLLDIARECNDRLNYNKLQHKKTEVDFFGETYTIGGCKPTQNKVSAINTMPEPSSKKEVQSFIQMIDYLSKFSARLSELSEPIWELSKERVPFNWGPKHKEAFNVIKKELVKALIFSIL